MTLAIGTPYRGSGEGRGPRKNRTQADMDIYSIEPSIQTVCFSSALLPHSHASSKTH